MSVVTKLPNHAIDKHPTAKCGTHDKPLYAYTESRTTYYCPEKECDTSIQVCETQVVNGSVEGIQ